MPNGLAPHFIATYARPFEILHKPHLDIYKLSVKVVSHPTFHILKLKLRLHDEQRPDWNKRCDWKLMPLNIKSPLKLKAYSTQGGHALEARNAW
jgi:hypothetical protein